MKIGILTYHRAENYGALLQAYALKTYLLSLGHQVSFVDYWPDYHKDYFKLFSWNNFCKSNWKQKIYMVYLNTFWLFVRYKRKRNFLQFMRTQLNLDSRPKYKGTDEVVNGYDVVFYGSDQIWRKQGFASYPGFDFWYFGSDNIKAKKIVYAGSMGNTKVTHTEEEQLKQYFAKFSAISVRESILQHNLKAMDIQSTWVTDPVFLLEKMEWLKLCGKTQRVKDPYILVYNLLGSNETVSFAKELSNRYRYPIIEMNKLYNLKSMGKGYVHAASIPDFLSLIENAAYVVSNSFHGVALSIIMQKQFFAVGMDEKAGRVKSLLSLTGLENRYIESVHFDDSDIQYDVVNEKLKAAVESSKQFIKQSLE